MIEMHQLNLRTMQKILLIDDDVELTAMLKEFLQNEGFKVSIANNGESGAQYIMLEQFDLTVLDVMMPGMNGFETLKTIRQHSDVPVIMLTAKGDESDRFSGLEQGADDYVPKPCTPRELSARIRAILRRTSKQASSQGPQDISLGDLNIMPKIRRATWQNDLIQLTSVEFNLLMLLAKSVGNVVSKEKLSEQGLGRKLTKFDRSIDVHISSIRHKLNALPDHAPKIETIYRMGYQLVKKP